MSANVKAKLDLLRGMLKSVNQEALVLGGNAELCRERKQLQEEIKATEALEKRLKEVAA